MLYLHLGASTVNQKNKEVNMIPSFKKKKVKILKPDQTYHLIECVVQPHFAKYDHPTVSVDEGDILEIDTPHGIEKHVVVEANFYDTGLLEPHYQLKLEKESLYRKKQGETPIQQVSIRNIQNSTIAFGDNKSQQIIDITIPTLIKKIEESNATTEEKNQLLSKLKEILRHPIVVSIIGKGLDNLL